MDFWEHWEQELAQEKEDIKKMKQKKIQEAMQSRYNFTINEPIKVALEKLEKLAVDRYRNVDYCAQDGFDDVWRSVLHEVDLYEEGEESPLNGTTVKGAKNWLKSFSHLCTERVPEEYKSKEK